MDEGIHRIVVVNSANKYDLSLNENNIIASISFVTDGLTIEWFFLCPASRNTNNPYHYRKQAVQSDKSTNFYQITGILHP